MLAEMSAGIRNFAERYGIAINDPDLIRRYRMEMDWLRDERTRIAVAENRGRAEGRVEGRAEGRAEGEKKGRAEGEKKGRMEGKLLAYHEMVNQGLLTPEKAAELLGITLNEFLS